MARAALIPLACLSLMGCGGSTLDTLSLEPLPEWTDRYAASKKGDVRFFNMSALMARYGIDRLQAVELQNHYRDLTREGMPSGAAFSSALSRVQAHSFESGLSAQALAAADFIVVWDLDETLYNQRVPKSCADISFERPGKKPKNILLAPGWQAAFERVKDAGGLNVLFSANLDQPTQRNLEHWKVAEKSLLETGLIAGLMTNSYLVQQHKSEGAGAKSPTRGQPVLEPSKDLRPFDETLSKVVIIDDNPSRLFQLRNARSIPKLSKARYCSAGLDEKASFESTLPIVVDELLEAAAIAKVEGISFAQAWLPFSILGQVKVRHLMDTLGWTQQTAARWVRKHPDAIADTF